MLIQIEAQDIDELLDEEECLAPLVEDLLLDALLAYREKPKGIYEHSGHISSSNDLNVKITITTKTPQFITGMN